MTDRPRANDEARPGPRAEALKAIAHVKDMLSKEMTPLDRRIAGATLDHARENVEAIQELKHRRREKPTAGNEQERQTTPQEG